MSDRVNNYFAAHGMLDDIRGHLGYGNRDIASVGFRHADLLGTMDYRSPRCRGICGLGNVAEHLPHGL